MNIPRTSIADHSPANLEKTSAVAIRLRSRIGKTFSFRTAATSV
jgi:hypothetical protein